MGIIGRWKGAAASAVAALAVVSGSAAAGDAASTASPVAVQLVSKSVRLLPGSEVSAVVRCPAGQVATGGGAYVREDDPVMITAEGPANDVSGWYVRAASLEDEDGPTATVKLRAVCARGAVVSPPAEASRTSTR